MEKNKELQPVKKIKSKFALEKITWKLIQYFISIITIVIFLCFLTSSIFLSKIYVHMQYKSLEEGAKEIYALLKTDGQELELSSNIQISAAFLLKDNNIVPLLRTKTGRMSFLKNMQYDLLKQKGELKNAVGEKFLYYKLQTDLGNIVVLQNNKFSSNYLSVIYTVLLLVFLLALLLSIPIISYAGKKFTTPILKLQKASHDLAQGNFNVDFTVNTEDEIEALSKSLQDMASSLEKKNALQRDFVANVSHDFKTPLSIIRNYSEAIYDDMIEEKMKKNYSKQIIREVDMLNGLVMDLLELSKLQGGASFIKKEPFDFFDFLMSFHSTFKSVAENKNINFTVECPKININGDSKYLYRVLYNFLDNAFKFSPNCSKIEVLAVCKEEVLQVSIKDQGIGMEKEMLENIWHRYYKHSKSGGMGLGLAICSEILKLHGFSYGVTSTPLVGTEFYFTIPKNETK